MKRIAVLTSGGDSPGMNAAIRAVVRQGIDLGMEVYGVNSGYKGLVDSQFKRFQLRDVSGIIEHGGTILHSRRMPEFKEEHIRDKAIRVLNKRKIDGLIVIGGNGSLKGARALYESGFPTVGVPATIDNDVCGTDISIGVDTALNMVVGALDRIRDTAASLERAFIVEVMGRESGYIALMGGLAGGAEAILIPEVEYDYDEVAEKIYEGYKKGKEHSNIVVAEGVYPEGSAAHYVGEKIKESIGFEMRVTVLGYMQRGGSPSAWDRSIGSRLGAAAVHQLDEGNGGVMVGMVGQEIKPTELAEVTEKTKKIDLDLYELSQVLSK